ncbi:MAG: shikimate dehydrogenase [Rothia sp. (in: high G+C Gram-positive bacteria)]|uniref:shikimate dehydrogenase n=1 Tax=Rothia sp. (in: high G+C Gram-positive bacteria) TaxID=1885016 RepID=UPI0026DEC1D3|nr:shikimate dehydrogenase [Rothia sp. (in: high G+C Gram-positive bacteria)]MDO5749650.1 shikimate dehydrogenase [Rothia sp. (in: high G+C Gram-positive bacteria)]
MSLREESFLVGLIGDGITTSLTPPMHEAEASELGLRYLYRPIDLDALNLDAASLPALLDAAQLLGYNAFNITHPCKQSVMEYVDELSEDARALGAVNCVLLHEDGTRYGDNTDFSGFMRALSWGLPEVADSTRALSVTVQLGAGGAGSATAYALLKKGEELGLGTSEARAQQLYIFDPDAAKSAELIERLRARFPQAQIDSLESVEQLGAALKTAHGLVNATPIGMHVHPGIPLNPALLHSGLWVADVIYLPQETELIRAARAAGCAVLPGGFMAVGQAVDAFELFTGSAANAERMKAHFEQLLAQQQGIKL